MRKNQQNPKYIPRMARNYRREWKNDSVTEKDRVYFRFSDPVYKRLFFLVWFLNILINYKGISRKGPKTELGDHDFCLSRSHYTDTDPTSRERAATPGIEPGTSSPGLGRIKCYGSLYELYRRKVHPAPPEVSAHMKFLGVPQNMRPSSQVSYEKNESCRYYRVPLH